MSYLEHSCTEEIRAAVEEEVSAIIDFLWLNEEFSMIDGIKAGDHRKEGTKRLVRLKQDEDSVKMKIKALNDELSQIRAESASVIRELRESYCASRSPSETEEAVE